MLMVQLEKTIAIALATAGCTLAAPVSAQSLAVEDVTRDDDSVRMSTGLHFSTGDYGEGARTSVVTVPLAIKYTKDNLSVRVALPYVWIDGPATLLDVTNGGDTVTGGAIGRGDAGVGGLEETDPAPARNQRGGIGDIAIAATYSFDLGSDFYIDATGRVKLPTASRRNGIGTGKADVMVSADFGRDIGPASLYLHARKRFIDAGTATYLRDNWGAGAGISYEASDSVTLGADYDWQQSAVRGDAASSEITGWANVRLARTLSLSLYGSRGMSDESTDFAGGMTLSVRVD